MTPLRKQTTTAAWLAAAVAVATRLPFAARRLWDHDSVQFALGVEHYDLAAHHPHPPGYPLYIGVLKVLAALGVDSLHGMVALTVLSAGLGAACMVLLVTRLMLEAAAVAKRRAAAIGSRAAGGKGRAATRVVQGPVAAGAGAARGADSASDPARSSDTASGPARGSDTASDPARGSDTVSGSAWGWAAEAGGGAALVAGVFAAALFIFNPLLWFYGELPLVYAVEGGMTVALALAALRMSDGRAAFLLACGAFALAGGIRPSTLLLLLPLFFFGVWRAWRRGAAWTTLAAGGAVSLAVGLAWLLPLLAAAGGLGGYRRISAEHFSALLPYTSILYGAGVRALAHNLTIMTKWFLQGLLPAAAALVVLWLLPPRPRLARVAAGARLAGGAAAFLAAWALPPMMFFALFHITKAGYTLVYLPALLAAASVLAAPALAAIPGRESGARATARESGEREAAGASRERETAGATGDREIAGDSRAKETVEASRTRKNAGESGRTQGRRAWVGVAVAAAVGAGFFLFGADRRPDQPRALAVVRNEFNRGTIATYERDLDHLLWVLRAFPPRTTTLATVELSGTGAGGPDAFLYPWQRHLQWYLPGYEVLHLVPEDRLAFVTQGHQPFRRAGADLVLASGTQRLALVLSGPTGDRFPISWPLHPIGSTFEVVLVPVPRDGLRLGPFTFTVPPPPPPPPAP